MCLGDALDESQAEPDTCVVGAYAFGAATKRLDKRGYQLWGELLAGVLGSTMETEYVEHTFAADALPATTRERLAARRLDGRTGTADDVAATIAFIASDSGGFFNGASVTVDGGMAAV